jgi:hypothetical protein
MVISKDAAVIASAEVEVAAGAGVVWDVIADIPGWPSWNPDVNLASLSGPLAPGSEFRWRSGPGSIKSTLQQVQPPHLISWTGKTMGITAVHVWAFTPQDNSTLVRTEETWDGFVPRLLRKPMLQVLQRYIDRGLASLKVEAERRQALQTK